MYGSPPRPRARAREGRVELLPTSRRDCPSSFLQRTAQIFPKAGDSRYLMGGRRRIAAGPVTDQEVAGRMADYWTVVRKPEGDESPHVGPFQSREEAEDWANEQIEKGRDIIAIHKLDMPIGLTG